MQHFRRGAAGIQQLLFGNRLLVYNTDGSVDSHIGIHNRRFVHGDTDILIQKAYDAGHGIINHHAAGIQHTAHHVNSVLGRGKLIRYLDAAPAVHNDLDIVVGVDIHLLDARLINPFIQKRIAGHIFIELFAEFRCCQPVRRVLPLD